MVMLTRNFNFKQGLLIVRAVLIEGLFVLNIQTFQQKQKKIKIFHFFLKYWNAKRSRYFALC